jgi:hypothetical protein
VAGSIPDPSAVLASLTVSNATIPVSNDITAHFSPAPQVSAGTEYAVSVSHPGSDSSGVETVTGDPCAGDLFFGGPAPQTFFPEGSDHEMVFAAFVTPPPAPPAVATPSSHRKCKKKRRKGKARDARKKKRCKKRKRK